ncbi:hypothetical protein [Acinetobacter nosocomialis]|uniref:hypothetical protein n=1 Tax=Acinetobacter nosocomialis TaxID=106654 RepID=UPI00339EC04D
MSFEITNPYVLHVLSEEGFKFETHHKSLTISGQKLLFEFDFGWGGKLQTVLYENNTYGLNFVQHGGERIIYRYGNVSEFNSDHHAVVLTIRALHGLWNNEKLKAHNDKGDATHFSKSNGRYYLITYVNTYFWRDEVQCWEESKSTVDDLLDMILVPLESDNEIKASPLENLHVPKTSFDGTW